MKCVVERQVGWPPVELTVTFETQDELRALLAIINLPVNHTREYYKEECKDPYKSVDYDVLNDVVCKLYDGLRGYLR